MSLLALTLFMCALPHPASAEYEPVVLMFPRMQRTLTLPRILTTPDRIAYTYFLKVAAFHLMNSRVEYPPNETAFRQLFAEATFTIVKESATMRHYYPIWIENTLQMQEDNLAAAAA